MANDKFEMTNDKFRFQWLTTDFVP
jgi:hypothetical protein